MAYCRTIFAVVAALAVPVLLLAATTTYNYDYSTPRPQMTDGMYAVVMSDVDGDVNDWSSDTHDLYGYLVSIVVDSNGTDTEFGVEVADQYGNLLFDKDDFTSASEPYRYPIISTDTASNVHRGAAIGGPLTVTVADADDATLDELRVVLYVRNYWRQ